MFVRAYLRASTTDQDASRAKDSLEAFAEVHKIRIAAFYVENRSGTTLDRPQLQRLLSDAGSGDVLLVEAVDRLSRLDRKSWGELRELITKLGVSVVSIDLPLTHDLLRDQKTDDGLGEWMKSALSQMFLEFTAAFARNDYEVRRARVAQGIRKAKEAGLYKGRPKNELLHSRIRECLDFGMSVRGTAKLLQCSTSTIARAKKSDNILENGVR